MKNHRFLQPLEVMSRISRQELPEKLDEILEIIDRDNVGYVITDEGKPHLVLCPVDWFNHCFDNDFGCILNSAVRYALGRNTYMPDTVARYVNRYLSVLDSRTLNVMSRDIEDALTDATLSYHGTWALLKGAIDTRLKELSRREASSD